MTTDNTTTHPELRRYPKRAKAEDETRDLELYRLGSEWWIRRVGAESGIPATNYERQLWKQLRRAEKELEKARGAR